RYKRLLLGSHAIDRIERCRQYDAPDPESMHHSLPRRARFLHKRCNHSISQIRSLSFKLTQIVQIALASPIIGKHGVEGRAIPVERNDMIWKDTIGRLMFSIVLDYNGP